MTLLAFGLAYPVRAPPDTQSIRRPSQDYNGKHLQCLCHSFVSRSAGRNVQGFDLKLRWRVLGIWSVRRVS